MNLPSASRAPVVVVIASLAITGVCAQDYPHKPIRLLVPFSTGGGNDTLGRVFGQKFTDGWGQSVIVENRPGAGGTLATALVARAAPDG
jgi:tripartite-type tricarboxylate transporter receptor subunit TctC